MKKITLLIVMAFLFVSNVYADDELLIDNMVINNAIIEPKFDKYNNYYSVTINDSVTSLDINCEYNLDKYNVSITNNDNLIDNKFIYVTIYNKETNEKNIYILKIFIEKSNDTVANVEDNAIKELKIENKEKNKLIAPSVGFTCFILIIFIYYLMFLR